MSKPTTYVRCEDPKCIPGDGDEAIKTCRWCKRRLCDLCDYEHGHKGRECPAETTDTNTAGRS